MLPTSLIIVPGYPLCDENSITPERLPPPETRSEAGELFNVLELIWTGLSFDDIVRDYYPNLQVEDIRACIRYAMDIIVAADLGASRAADEELLSIAQEHKRLFMTRNRDFGSLVSVKELGAGIIYLRILP